MINVNGIINRGGKEEIKVQNILDPFHPNTNFLSLMRMTLDIIHESVDPVQIIAGIGNLRRLVKFHEDLFIIIFDDAYDSFDRFMFNENHDIVIVSFIFLSELFSNDWQHPQMRDWVQFLIPLVLQMSADNNFLENDTVHNLSLTVLDLLSCKGFYEDTLFILLKGMGDTNEVYSLNASLSLHKFMTKCEINVLVNCFDWNFAFEEIFELVSKKKMDLARGFVKTMRDLIFNKDDFNYILSTLSEDLLQHLMMIEPFDYAAIIKLKEEIKRDRKKIANN